MWTQHAIVQMRQQKRRHGLQRGVQLPLLRLLQLKSGRQRSRLQLLVRQQRLLQQLKRSGKRVKLQRLGGELRRESTRAHWVSLLAPRVGACGTRTTGATT